MYIIIYIVFISISFCKCLQAWSYRIGSIHSQINKQRIIIANLDDIIDYHHNKNIIGLMTHILPLFIHYNKIEFVISYKKINNLFTPKDTKFKNEIITYIIISLGILAKKTNTEITIIYSKFSTLAIDYYILLHLQDGIDILKKNSISVFTVPPSRINVMKFNQNDISYHSINRKPINQKINYNRISIIEFFE